MPTAHRLSSALALAVLLGAPGASHAARLLSTARTATSMDGVSDVQKVVLDRQGLRELRGRHRAVVQGFPLGRKRSTDLVLERFTAFAPDARVEVMGRNGAQPLALPDNVYFSGTVAGEEGSRVFLAAGRTRVHGFVVSDGEVYPFGPDGRGGHRTYALRDADPTVHRPPTDFCYNDLHPEAVALPAAELEALAAMPAVADAPGTIRVADVAIETDQEFRAKFSSDASALDYLASLAAAASAIYERDVAVRLRFSYVRLWGAAATDPWTASETSATLSEFRSYWNNAANDMAAIAGQRTLVHFISGKRVQGGIAYLSALCSQSYGYGVSQVYGSFDLSRPSQIWDVLVFTHELGHNFGSPHSHCYSPPLDQCYGQESGCYSGAAVTSRGGIMSYCHLRSGGLGNIDMMLGGTVGNRIGQHVGGASCLGTVSVSTTTTTTVTTSSTTSTTRTTTSTTTTSSVPVTTTSTRPPTTTTTRPPTTTTSSTRPPTTSTTTTTSSTTSTRVTVPPTTTTLPRPPADDDRDGVPDAGDACPDTPSGELVDASGCSLCPCDGPRSGGTWTSRRDYLRCMRNATRDPGMEATERRATKARARTSSCGRRARTRCCLYSSAADTDGRCRVMAASTCAARANGVDLGAGSCAPSLCTR